MNRSRVFRLAFVLALLAASALHSKELPPPAAGFDGAKLFGKWHEIARLPNPFEEGLIRVTSTYSPLPDGRIEVVNRGVKDGKPQEIRGRAWIENAALPAKMKLSFFLWFASDYVVTDFDRNGYGWLAIRGGSFDRLWIFSRLPAMDPSVYGGVLERAQKSGFDTARLERVPQE